MFEYSRISRRVDKVLLQHMALLIIVNISYIYTNLIPGKLLAKQNKSKELATLIKSIRPFLGVISKAKASKIVRELVDTFLDMGSKTGLEIPLCLECIDWAKG